MAAMFIESGDSAETVPVEPQPVAVEAPTVIFEDESHPPLPIRDPKSASLIFKPSGQGCFP